MYHFGYEEVGRVKVSLKESLAPILNGEFVFVEEGGHFELGLKSN